MVMTSYNLGLAKDVLMQELNNVTPVTAIARLS